MLSSDRDTQTLMVGTAPTLNFLPQLKRPIIKASALVLYKSRYLHSHYEINFQSFWKSSLNGNLGFLLHTQGQVPVLVCNKSSHPPPPLTHKSVCLLLWDQTPRFQTGSFTSPHQQIWLSSNRCSPPLGFFSNNSSFLKRAPHPPP